jgi:chromosome partitioning protein
LSVATDDVWFVGWCAPYNRITKQADNRQIRQPCNKQLKQSVMKKNPLFVAVSNQKGGVGKSTMLVTLASLLSYSMDRNIAIVDCDSTQRSLFNLRERDMEMVEKNKKYMVQLDEQRLRGRRIYPIRRARPEDARQIAGELAETGDYDIIFIDLPGTMDVSGVLQTIFNVDYVLTPIAADNFVMDSSFSFASSVMKFTRERKDIPLKDVFLFWTKVRRRSNTEVLNNYMALMKKQGLKVLDSTIPDLCRYEKELSSSSRTFFRCSLLPPPAGQLKGSGLQELADELIVKLNF